MSASEARAVLNKLVDLAEERPPEARERRIQRRLQQRFEGPEAQAAHDALLEQARAAGAVDLERGRRELTHLYVRIFLVDLDRLYRFLDRTPAREQAEHAAGEIDALAERLSGARPEAETIAAAWRAGRAHAGFGRADVVEACEYLRALDVVIDGAFGGGDMRTISTRRLGDSKLLERQASRIARALRARGLVDEATDDREALAARGLEKFPPEVRLAGPVRVVGAELGRLALVALPPEHVADVAIPDGAPLVTIENLASFNRYVREARAEGELAIYTGGFPSRAVAELLATVGSRVSTCHHWGDIDAPGVRIAADVGRHLGRLPRLWQMTPELARAHGRPVAAADSGSLPDNAPPEYTCLASFLAGSDPHALEQEDLDPVSPARTPARGPGASA